MRINPDSDEAHSNLGVGLASHQIGKDLKLFIIDTIQIKEEMEVGEGLKKVFINIIIMLPLHLQIPHLTL